MEVNSFQILLFDVESLTFLKCGIFCADKKGKLENMRHQRSKG